MAGTTFTYDADGLRVGKTSSGKTTTYYPLNGKYVGEKTVVNGTTYYISYYYDENGAPAGLNVNGSAYFFVKNLQGDVTAVLNHTGAVVARYTYDAWGQLLSVRDGNNATVSNAAHVANLNPFRYRGYIYDTETGLYYLNSRYYDAEVGRFLNADQYISTGQGVLGCNMFAYCGNNPVMLVDRGGNYAEVAIPGLSQLWQIIGQGFIALGGAAAGALVSTGALIVGGIAAVGLIGFGIYNSATVSPAVGPTIATPVVPAVQDKGNEPSASIPYTDSVTQKSVQETQLRTKHLFFGADIVGKEWKIITFGMTLKEAVQWVEAVSASNMYGKGASWGVYTDSEIDAYVIATILKNYPEPIYHSGKGSQFSHFHVGGFKLFGKYKHFHVWYGGLQ